MSTQQNNKFLIDAIKDAREDALIRLAEAAKALRADPDNFDHYFQVQYCLKAYVEAQHILKPVFFS